MKYVLLKKIPRKKKIPRLYFKGYEATNKPIWTDNKNEAAQYAMLLALRMKQRLACQSQCVILLNVWASVNRSSSYAGSVPCPHDK